MADVKTVKVTQIGSPIRRDASRNRRHVLDRAAADWRSVEVRAGRR